MDFPIIRPTAATSARRSFSQRSGILQIDTDALIDIDEVPWDYKEQFGEPDIVGRNYELKISEVLDRPNLYEDVIALLENDDFPLKAEFLAAREYLTELLDRHDSVGDDFFDVFR